ncbi:hypothetical protein ACFL42_03730, partial [Candidatus Omnitrophota bacterium]
MNAQVQAIDEKKAQRHPFIIEIPNSTNRRGLPTVIWTNNHMITTVETAMATTSISAFSRYDFLDGV